MKTWIKGGLIGAGIGIALHLIINFGPLIIGYLFNSRDILSISNRDLYYNITRIIIYLVIGFVIGIIVGWIIKNLNKGK